MKGIGEKGAKELVATFGSLEEIYARIGELKGKRREALEAGREDAFRSRELATVRRDAPVPGGESGESLLAAFGLPPQDPERLAAFYEELGFFRLKKELLESRAAAHAAADGRRNAGRGRVRRSGGARGAPRPGDGEGRGRRSPRLGDVRGRPRRVPRPRGRSGARGPSRRMRAGATLSSRADRRSSRPSREEGSSPPRSRGTGPTRGARSSRASSRTTGSRSWPTRASGSTSRRPPSGSTLRGASSTRCSRPTSTDRASTPTTSPAMPGPSSGATRRRSRRRRTWRGATPSRRRPSSRRKRASPTSPRGPFSRSRSARSCSRGSRRAPPRSPSTRRSSFRSFRSWRGWSSRGSPSTRRRSRPSPSTSARASRALEKEIHAAAGEPFNVGSPPQLGRILFEKLKYPVLKKTAKTKSYATGSEVLEELAVRGVGPLPGLVLEWRELSKLKGTYVDALPRHVAKDGRIHTRFDQAVAATGRLSSNDPNLQNIPVRTEAGRAIRKAFVAPPGRLLVAADYSQVELRLLAHLSGDAALIETFRRGEDIHRATAAKIFGIDPGLVSSDQRRGAKTINFGILYGMGPFALAGQLGVPQAAAKSFIAAYFEQFPSIRACLDGILAKARETGATETILGRLRPIPGIVDRNHAVRANAERMAMNAPFQGSAADLIKKAMVELDRRLVSAFPSARMLLQVHDELVLECDAADAPGVAALARETMEGVAALAVPLTVDTASGANWAAAK